MAIKDVLREELENSIRMKKGYEKKLSELPRGSLQKKIIKDNVYYYVAFREKGRVKFEYKGKEVSKKMQKEYEHAKKLRAEYRKNISQLKKQIKYLKGALRGKEPV